MKKYYLIILFTLFSSISFSQIIQDYGLKIGYVNSGQSYTNFSFEDNLIRKSGFSISAFTDLFNIDGFSLSPEVKYIQKGVGFIFVITGEEGPEPLGEKISHVYLNYISIPLSILYKIPLSAGIPYLKIAPRYDIFLSSYDDFNSAVAASLTDYKNTFGMSFSVGFIPEFDLEIKPFVEFSYHYDITDSYSNVNISIKNNAFEISLGILL